MSIFGDALGSIGSGIFNMYGAKNPSDYADPFLSQIGGHVNNYMNPYIQSGQRAMGTLEGEYGQNLNDPTRVMNRIGSGFQQSPGYQFQVNQATEAAKRAQAAGGMLGTPAHQQQIAGTVNDLANQDYYNYTDRGMDQYNRTMGGYSDMNNMGFNASTQALQALIQQLMAQAENAYAGANTDNQQMGGGIGSIISGLF